MDLLNLSQKFVRFNVFDWSYPKFMNHEQKKCDLSVISKNIGINIKNVVINIKYQECRN
ncbi:8119_t:CDS:2 [Cetraspora pellucida]|uniref:8119_t:CDS:1 n=1 Tax=Cetraspora pellucida TaxID=1433469 RepID=A0ACA9KRL3_9GLOM|nr:8119_t:CDS:2 [Cetraspora pellucida]